LIEIDYNGKKGYFISEDEKLELEKYLFSKTSANEEVIQ